VRRLDHTGDVKHHVKLAEVLNGRGDSGCDLGTLSDVAGNGDGASGIDSDRADRVRSAAGARWPNGRPISCFR
jgi:hypothetical protein